MTKMLYTIGVTKETIASLKSHNVDLVLDIRANKPVLPKSRGPSGNSREYMNKTITDARIEYRWVVSLANDFGNLDTDYGEWINNYPARTLLKGIAHNTIQKGVTNLCILCNERDTRVHAAVGLQTELNKMNGDWVIQHL